MHRPTRPFALVFLAAIIFASLAVPLPAQKEAAEKGGYLSNLKQLTSAGEKSGEGYFSPDGRQIVYQSVREGCPHYQIYRQDLATGEAVRVSPGNGLTTCAYFNPCNGAILFASTHLDPATYGPPPKTGGRYVWNKHESFDIFTAHPDGSGLLRLTDAPGYDAEGSYSSDGGSIVFTSARDGDLEIYTMRSDGTGVKRITHSKGYDGGPFFSPDGRLICFRGFRDLRPGKERYAQVYVVGIDGRGERQLTFNTAVNWAPYFHPDGKHLVYCTNIGGHRNFEVVLLRLSDARIVRLTHDDGADVMPVFSPDGKKLMWTTTRYGGRSQLVIADFQMPPPDAFGEPLKDDPAADHSSGHGEGRRPRGGEGHRSGGDVHAREKAAARTAHATDRQGAPSATSHRAPVSGEAAITAGECLDHVKVLASDEYGGRKPGTEGCEKAACYIETEFRKLGLVPAGSRDYRHEFTVTVGCRAGKNNRAGLTFRHGNRRHGVYFGLDETFTPMPFTANGSVHGPAVFVGYGVTTPDGKWDDYEGVDAKGRVVVCFLAGTPEIETDPEDPHGGLGLYSGARYKAFNAVRHGAAGIVFVADRRQRDRDGLRSLLHAGAESRGKIPAVQVRRPELLSWCAEAGVDLDEVEKAIHAGKRPQSRPLDFEVELQTDVQTVREKTCNVLARVPGRDPALRGECIVIGAHYDHLGHGGAGSLASGGGLGQIHNGADDNASGVAGLLELGEYFKARPLRRSVLLIAFSGEEMGLLGSEAWVTRPTQPLDRCVAMLNLDMIGRLGSDGVAIDGVDTLAAWRRIVTESAGDVKVAMTGGSMSGRSDHASFIGKHVPALHFFTGAHEDYHRPTDDVDKINAPGMQRVLELVRGVAEAVDAAGGDQLAFVEPERKKRVSTGRGYGAYLGTIPSYTQDEGGVRLNGASAGSPAEKAGIEKGDVLVELGGIAIDNIYDFTNALRSLKPGATVGLVVERGGRRVEMKATLARR